MKHDLDPKKAIVLFSGGMDSVFSLMVAKEVMRLECLAMFIHYNQDNVSLELHAAMDASDALGVELMVQDAAHARGSKPGEGEFVPARNLLMVTLAAQEAYWRGWGSVVLGATGYIPVHDEDPYPDCTKPALASFEESASIALGQRLRVFSPSMHMTRAETFYAADLLERRGIVDGAFDVIRGSYSCGRRDHTEHDWGLGCGKCESCQARSQGWEVWLRTQ